MVVGPVMLEYPVRRRWIGVGWRIIGGAVFTDGAVPERCTGSTLGSVTGCTHANQGGPVSCRGFDWIRPCVCVCAGAWGSQYACVLCSVSVVCFIVRGQVQNPTRGAGGHHLFADPNLEFDVLLVQP